MNQQEEHIIDTLKKGTPPLPSDDYFAQLKSNLLARTGPAQAKVVPLYRNRWFIATATAASIVLVVSLFFRGQETPVRTAKKVDWSSVSQEEVLAYIHANIDDFEPETIASHLDSIPDWNETIASNETNGDLSAATPPAAGKSDNYDHLLQTIDKEDILEYLQEEAVDIDDEMLIGS